MQKYTTKIAKNLYIDDIENALKPEGKSKLIDYLFRILPTDFAITCSVTVGDCIYKHIHNKKIYSEGDILKEIQNIYDNWRSGDVRENLTGYITRDTIVSTLGGCLDVKTQLDLIDYFNKSTYRAVYDELIATNGTIQYYLRVRYPDYDEFGEQATLGAIRMMCDRHLTDKIIEYSEGVVLLNQPEDNHSSPEFITAMQSVSDCNADQDKPIIGIEVDDALDHAVGAVGSVIDSDVDHAVEKKRGQYDEKLKATQTQIKKVTNQLTKLTAQKEKLETKRDLLDVLGTHSGKRLLEFSISTNKLMIKLIETSCVDKDKLTNEQNILISIDNNGDIDTDIHQNHCYHYWKTPNYGYDTSIISFQCIITDAKFDEFLSMIQKNVLHITWDIVKTMYDVLFDDKNFMRLVHQCSSKQILSIRSHPIMTTWNKFFRDKDTKTKIKTKNKEED